MTKLPAAERVLIYAMALIQRGWVQKAWAKDVRGYAVSLDNPKAVSFCLVAALARSTADLRLNPQHYYSAVGRLEAFAGGRSLTQFNDRTTRVQVLAALKCAALTTATKP